MLLDAGVADEVCGSGQTIYNWAHAWRDSGVCGPIGGHNGGRPRALSEAMVATALHVARAESLTLARIAQRVRAAAMTRNASERERLLEQARRIGA
ncbi:hypothetical protein [Paraburkholderia sp. GAS348]|uniref:hypothetical protein n=1 Tax=Paraburkholderia sp. GAS348 TaxID=3035132 RepID=UPI003D226F0B